MEKGRVIILGHLVLVSIGNQSGMAMNRSMQKKKKKEVCRALKFQLDELGKKRKIHSLIFFFKSQDRHIMNIYYEPNTVLCAEFSNMVPAFMEFIV